MALEQDRRDWLRRVLGVSLGDGAVDPALVAGWQDARRAVSAEMDAFRKAVLADADVAADPRFAFVKAALAELPRMLPPSAKRLDKALAGPPGPDRAREILAAAAATRAELAAGGLPRIEAVAARSLGSPVRFHATLSDAIAAVERAVGRPG